jgi:hypothetical protein
MRMVLANYGSGRFSYARILDNPKRQKRFLMKMVSLTQGFGALINRGISSSPDALKML